MAGAQRGTGTGTLEETKNTTQLPPMFRVVLHNDNYTTMDFVVEVLEQVFHKPPAEAYRIMMQVHTQERGVCGVYPHDIAETRVTTVHEMARERGFPLRASLEAE